MKERGIWELSRVLLWQITSLTTLTNTDCTDKWPNRRCSCCIQLWFKPSLPTNCLLLPLSCGSAGELFVWALPQLLTIKWARKSHTAYFNGLHWVGWFSLNQMTQALIETAAAAAEWQWSFQIRQLTYGASLGDHGVLEREIHSHLFVLVTFPSLSW